MKTLIYLEDAINAIEHKLSEPAYQHTGEDWYVGMNSAISELYNLSSAEPEQPTGVQDILQYLDEYLHPIVAPEHWSVYSELYDMVSMLPSAHPEPLSVWTWLLDYQIKVAKLKGRYTPYEVLSWVVNDWRKEHE